MEIGDIRYIVDFFSSYSYDYDHNYSPIEYAEQILIIPVQITALDTVTYKRVEPIKYKLKAVNSQHNHYVSGARPYQACRLFENEDTAKQERKRQLQDHLEATKRDFNEQIQAIEKLIEN